MGIIMNSTEQQSVAVGPLLKACGKSLPIVLIHSFVLGSIKHILMSIYGVPITGLTGSGKRSKQNSLP